MKLLALFLIALAALACDCPESCLCDEPVVICFTDADGIGYCYIEEPVCHCKHHKPPKPNKNPPVTEPQDPAPCFVAPCPGA